MNLLDLAAVSVPAGFRADGLPSGVTLFGRPSAMAPWQVLAHACTEPGLSLGATGHAPGLELATAGLAQSDAECGRLPLVVCGHTSTACPQRTTHRAGRAPAPQHPDRAPLSLIRPDRRPAAPPGTDSPASGRGCRRSRGLVPAVGSSWEFSRWHSSALGLGSVELADGTWEKGFICEGLAPRVRTTSRTWVAAGLPEPDGLTRKQPLVG